MEGNLKNLLEFIHTQREKLKDSEDILNHLKKEQERLKPIVETDRKLVEAILEFQYSKTREDVWRERGIGFISGFLASLVASLIIRFMYRKKKIISQKGK